MSSTPASTVPGSCSHPTGLQADIENRLAIVERAIRVQMALGASHLQQVEMDPAAFGVPSDARTSVRRLRRERNRALHGLGPFVHAGKPVEDTMLSTPSSGRFTSHGTGTTPGSPSSVASCPDPTNPGSKATQATSNSSGATPGSALARTTSSVTTTSDSCGTTSGTKIASTAENTPSDTKANNGRELSEAESEILGHMNIMRQVILNSDSESHETAEILSLISALECACKF